MNTDMIQAPQLVLAALPDGLVWILIMAAVGIFQLMNKAAENKIKRNSTRPDQPPPSPMPDRTEDGDLRNMGDLLSEILKEATQKAPTPHHPHASPHPVMPPPLRQERIHPPTQPQAHPVPTPEPKKRPFVRSSAASPDDQPPPFVVSLPPMIRSQGNLRLAVGLPSLPSVVHATTHALHPLAAGLRNRDGIRQAFLYKEIIGPPQSTHY